MPYGDSFSAVQSASLEQDRQRRAQKEATLNRLLSMLNAKRSGDQRDRAMDQNDDAREQQQRQFDQEMGYRSGQDALNRTERDNARLQRDREFDATMKERQEYRDFLLKRSDQSREDAAMAKRQQMDYSTALEMSDAGAFGAAEEVQKAFPNLDPASVPALLKRSLMNRQVMEEDDEFARSAADTVNQARSLRHMIGQERLNPSKPPMLFGKNTPDEDAIKEWQTELGEVEQAAKSFMDDKRFPKMLRPDENGNFRPTYSLPWRSSGAAAPTVPQTDAGSGAAAPAAPSADPAAALKARKRAALAEALRANPNADPAELARQINEQFDSVPAATRSFRSARSY